jgi:signal transduction histidine kinase
MPEPVSELARLLTLIAHEVRTPLTVANGYVKLLASGRSGPLTDEQAHAAAGAGRSCELLIVLAADISFLGRLERGEVAPTPAPLDLPTLIDKLARAHVSDPNHPVAVEVVSTEPLVMQADASHLERTFAALLHAVARTAPENSSVQIAWRAGATAPREVQIGLAVAGHLQAVLDGDASSLDGLDDSQAGLGVTLPVARRLAALAGGTIQATPDKKPLGVRVTLPLRA